MTGKQRDNDTVPGGDEPIGHRAKVRRRSRPSMQQDDNIGAIEPGSETGTQGVQQLLGPHDDWGE